MIVVDSSAFVAIIASEPDARRYADAIVDAASSVVSSFTLNGTSIFLNVPPEDLLKRIQKSEGNNRPLIDKKKSNEVLLNELRERYKYRLKFYEQADIQIDGSIEVEQILWLLEEIE